MSCISAFVKGYDAISTTRKRKEIKKLKNRINILVFYTWLLLSIIGSILTSWKEETIFNLMMSISPITFSKAEEKRLWRRVLFWRFKAGLIYCQYFTFPIQYEYLENMFRYPSEFKDVRNCLTSYKVNLMT